MGGSLWEALFVVSQKWIPFPTALLNTSLSEAKSAGGQIECPGKTSFAHRSERFLLGNLQNMGLFITAACGQCSKLLLWAIVMVPLNSPLKGS